MAKKQVKKIRIRMYRQGLGDCFLLTFPGSPDDFQVLIDCGVLLGTKGQDEIMKKVALNIKETTAGRIDLVVVTHEHWDHLSGFIQAKEIFKKIKFGTVWLAWTEDPKNKLAKKLKKEREEKKKALALALDKLVSTPLEGFGKAFKEVFIGFNGDVFAAKKGKTTKDALNYVSNKAEVKYCYPGNTPLSLEKLPGVRIYVLGPPEDEKLIKRDKPSKKYDEVYEIFDSGSLFDSFYSALLLHRKNTSGDEKDKSGPFESFYQVSLKDAKKIDEFKLYYSPDNEWRRIDDDWLSLAGELALNLDSDTNNTCLALAFELVDTGNVLLFPGDAQVGNWLSWEKLTWNVSDEKGHQKEVKSEKLLKQTVLYKVGHHGSHNATLSQKGLELMEHRDLVGMIPVVQEKAEKKKWEMPFPPLLKRLKEKTGGRIIRIDEGIPSKKDIIKLGLLKARERNKFYKNVELFDLYIDYFI